MESMDYDEAITFQINRSVDTPEGRLRLATAEEFLIGELERHRFNTERAIEIYTFAIKALVSRVLAIRIRKTIRH